MMSMTMKSADRVFRSAMAKARKWRTARSGNINVEMAIIAPVLVVLALGAFDIGQYGIEKIGLTSAARAGAHFGARDQSSIQDLAGITQAVKNSLGENGVTVTTQDYCSCPSSGASSVLSAKAFDGPHMRRAFASRTAWAKSRSNCLR